jgi:hypothetical protein
MYPINSITRSAQKDKKLNVLLFNDSYTSYVFSLGYCFNDINFYLFENRFQTSRWIRNWARPNNVEIIKSNESPIDIDAIIVINRGRSYEEAMSVSSYLHVPVILIDFASSEIMTPVPFFANSNITDRETLLKRSGNITIGINEYVSTSWKTPFQKVAMTIKPLAPVLSVHPEAKKVLVPRSVPDEYLQGLPSNILGGIEITKNSEEAGVYLNLWENLDEDAINCMANEIPVVSFASCDIPKECYFLVNQHNVNDTLKQFLNGQFSQEELAIINNTKKIAKEYVSTSQEDFKNSWQNVFSFIENTPYIRR